MAIKTRAWIPVEKSLPGLNEIVLVTNDGDRFFKKHGEGFSGCFTTCGILNDDYQWETFDDCQLIEITAWMPLPEPYRA